MPQEAKRSDLSMRNVLRADIDENGRSVFYREKLVILLHGEAMRLVPMIFAVVEGSPRFTFEIAEGARAREHVTVDLKAFDLGGDDWAAMAAACKDKGGKWIPLWAQVWEVKSTVGWNSRERWPQLKLLQVTAEEKSDLVHGRKARYEELNIQTPE